MPLRLVLILALLIQPALLPLAARSARQATCATDSCCIVVSTTTCCGEVVEEMRCGKTGGECRCAVEPDESDQLPATPRSPDRSELGPIFVTALGNVLDLATTARTLPRPTPPAIDGSHHETQAL
ncbi:MAG: hypothetical protein ACYTGP_10240, partial [Planctomycetota bacterium]